MTVHQKLAHLETPESKHPAVRDSAALARGIPIAPHRKSAEVVVSALGSDTTRGLVQAEATVCCSA